MKKERCNEATIRPARETDIPALMEIYNEAVLHTTASFDMERKDLENRKRWLFEHRGKYVIFVWEEEGIVKGYSSLSKYSDRKAYDKTAELSVYVGKAYRGQGIGCALTERALAFGKDREDIHVVISLITGENKISIALHEKLGFFFCGQMKEVGEKFGRVLDVSVYEKILDK